MRPSSQKIFVQSQVISEIIAAKKPTFTSIERRNIFDYVQSMADELSKLSTVADNIFLSYLLRLVEKEAQIAKRTAGQEVSAL
jgi:hypothetical protein